MLRPKYAECKQYWQVYGSYDRRNVAPSIPFYNWPALVRILMIHAALGDVRHSRRSTLCQLVSFIKSVAARTGIGQFTSAPVGETQQRATVSYAKDEMP